MIISISSRQVRARKIILDLVWKNCTFLHISHDVLKSSYMTLNNIFSENVEGTPTTECQFDGGGAQLLFGQCPNDRGF